MVLHLSVRVFYEYSPCFFPVENSHFGRPKTNFSGLKSEKKERRRRRRRRREKVLSSFCNFSSFHFQFSTFPFSIFLLFFSIFQYFLASLFPVCQQKFPVENCQGGTLPPAPPPADAYCHQSLALIKKGWTWIESIRRFGCCFRFRYCCWTHQLGIIWA